MKPKAWHIDRNAQSYTLARHWPPRFDVMAQADFPPARRGRLAQQIRQDLWRELKHLRGFSPVVQIRFQGETLQVTAGGRASKPIPPFCQTKIQDLLDCPKRRMRWLSWAGKVA